MNDERFNRVVETLNSVNSTLEAIISEIDRLEKEKQILADEVLSLRKRVDRMENDQKE